MNHFAYRGWLPGPCLLLCLCLLGCTKPTPPTNTASPQSTLDSQFVESSVSQSAPTSNPVPETPPKTEPSPEVAVTPEITPEPSAPSAEPVAEPAVEPDTPFTLESGFTALSFADFDTFAAEPETWLEQADGIHCTGKPKGYLYSKNSYENFNWRLEYRFERPKSLKDETKFKGNTGFLVYINGEQKLWPLCLEVQGKHVQMAAIKENGGASPVVTQDDEPARAAARKPVGQWNRLEIASQEGALTVKLNDHIISRSEPNFLSEGKIGIQAEDHPFVVRRMRIRAE